MHTIHEDMEAFQKQLRDGSIQRAYRTLLSYIMSLRAHFKKRYPDFAVSGLYQGYLDMTYFALTPSALKHHSLKIALVFNYETFRFGVWLVGRNRQVQRRYWELFEGSQWTDYRVVTPAKGVDAIVAYDLAEDFDFDDPDALTSTIEVATIAFIDDMERFLSEHQPDEGEALSPGLLNQ